MFRIAVVLLLTAFSGARAQTVIFVKADAPADGDGTSWASAYRFLHDGLDAATPLAAAGETVQLWIAAGSYLPDRSSVNPGGTGDLSATFTLGSRISLYGGFAGSETALDQRDPTANVTVLVGDLLGDDESGALTVDNSFVVLSITNADAGVVIDGVTVRSGRMGAAITDSNPVFRDCTFLKNGFPPSGSRSHGGASIDGGGSTWTNCRFVMNVVSGNGGALSVGGGAAVALHGCTFDSNLAINGITNGGAVYASSGSLEVADSVFHGNSADARAGALYAFGATVSRCLFDSNTASDGFAGAVYGDGAFTDCVFLKNVGDAGTGTASVGAASTFQRCSFFGSDSYRGQGRVVSGGGLFVDCVFAGARPPNNFYALTPSAGARIVGCVFFGNAVTSFGSALWGAPGVVVSNCIFWNNGPNGGNVEANQISGSPQVDHCFVAGLTGALGGIGNIGAYPYDDPLFVDPIGPDGIPNTGDEVLGLRPGSPCIDAGDNSALPAAETTDLDGNGRFRDDPGTIDTGAGSAPVVDMGAYEFQGTTCAPDFNHDGFLDPLDYNGYIGAFEAGDLAADFNRDGFIDPLDYNQFINAFEAGC